jgi:hypothetical protein
MRSRAPAAAPVIEQPRKLGIEGDLHPRNDVKVQAFIPEWPEIQFGDPWALIRSAAGIQAVPATMWGGGGNPAVAGLAQTSGPCCMTFRSRFRAVVHPVQNVAVQSRSSRLRWWPDLTASKSRPVAAYTRSAPPSERQNRGILAGILQVKIEQAVNYVMEINPLKAPTARKNRSGNPCERRAAGSAGRMSPDKKMQKPPMIARETRSSRSR